MGVLKEADYQAHGWKLGVNVGPTNGILSGIQGRRRPAVARSGRPISVIGWSLGGSCRPGGGKTAS